MSFPRYERYKDSGIEWLGEVPEHWNFVKLKHFTSFSGGGTPSRENIAFWNGDIPWVSPKDMKVEKIDGAEEYITETGLINSSASLLPAGMILLVVRSGILKHTIPVSINKVPVALNQDMKALSFSSGSCLNDFFLRWVQGLNDFLLLVWAKQGATVESIEHTYLAESVIPLPPFDEQSTIATFLGRETAKIDMLIAEQQRLIELLKEKRQAVISHAVTKGLNPDAPMKDSGIEWLGEVPEHWSVVPLKWFARCASGDSIPSDSIEPSNDDNSILVIGGNGVMGYTNQVNITYPVLVIGRVGALCGNVHFIQQPVWVTDNALILDASPEAFDLLYLAEVLRSRNLNNIASTTAQPLITGTQVHDQRVPRPTLTEQSTIATFIDNETTKLDALTAEAQTAITLLQERRTALISAAVTGKIDVRGLVEARPEREAAA